MKKYIPLSQLYINEVEKQPKNKILKTPKNTIIEIKKWLLQISQVYNFFINVSQLQRPPGEQWAKKLTTNHTSIRKPSKITVEKKKCLANQLYKIHKIFIKLDQLNYTDTP